MEDQRFVMEVDIFNRWAYEMQVIHQEYNAYLSSSTLIGWWETFFIRNLFLRYNSIEIY